MFNQLLVCAIFCSVWRVSTQLCVLDLDGEGTVINCALKKSSLFRIRNLGGIKTYISLGLSIGSESKFKESITNTEFRRRRVAKGSKFDARILRSQRKSQQKNVPVTSSTPKPKNSTPAFIEAPSPVLNCNHTYESTAPTLKKIFPVTIASPKISKEANVTERSGTSIPKTIALNQELVSKHIKDGINTSTTVPLTGIIERDPSQSKPILKAQKELYNENKIMLAPKEYHPLGYPKIFDETRSSRLRLPRTSFQCKHQKYFPGLYADEDLGCTVFHVCGVTGTGTVMRSFLCPKLTLFDQNTLKCNWWFYVDCKQSKQLYDTNMTITRSYQLMKILSILSVRKFPEAMITSEEKVP